MDTGSPLAASSRRLYRDLNGDVRDVQTREHSVLLSQREAGRDNLALAWSDAAREAAIEARRAKIGKHLKKLGFKKENTSGGGSEYYRHPVNDMQVRVSDHEVPESGRRW